MTKRSFIVAAMMSAIATMSMAQPRSGGQGGPNLSPEEQTMVRNIFLAADPTAKMKAIAELIKKHPQTAARPRVAQSAAEQIEAVKDPAQKLALAQQYQTIFTQPAEEELIAPVLIEAYAEANQPDEAFAKGAAFLAQHPDSLGVLVALVSIGTEQVKKQNAKFVTQTIQYGTHAVELFEADKKPDRFDEARWNAYKTALLPEMYQSLGLLYFASGNRAEAKIRYTKAAQLAPSDPFNFMMIASLLNQEYQEAAKQVQTMPAGKARDDQLKKVQAMIDQVIDGYAHAVAISEGNATLAPVRQQFLEDLQGYYKYRHNNSTNGMQELIDKYKPAKP